MKERMFVCRTPGCKNRARPGAITQSDYYDAAGVGPVVCVCGAECDYVEIEVEPWRPVFPPGDSSNFRELTAEEYAEFRDATEEQP